MKNCNHCNEALEKTLEHINKITERYLKKSLPEYNQIKEFLSVLDKNNSEEFGKKLEDVFNKLELTIILCNKESTQHIKKVLQEIGKNIKIIAEEIVTIDKQSRLLLEKIDKHCGDTDAELLQNEIKSFFDKFFNFINKINKKINTINDRLEEEIQNQLLKDRQIEELKEKVFIDDLTGLLNKRGFDEIYESITTVDNKLYLLFIDIDNFKQVNDTYGHIAGDLILKKLAEILKKNLRDEDIVARIYGDEFIILFRNVTKDIAYAIAERIRNTVAKGSFVYNNQKIKITISGGLSYLKNWLDKERNIEIADKLLYKAKQTGNKIEVEK